MLAYHGSPRSYKEHLAPTTPDHDLQAALAGHQADIFIGGGVARGHINGPGSVLDHGTATKLER